MSPETLITKQQLQIEEMKERLELYGRAVREAIGVMVCIGGPLNDNKLRYTQEQRRDFHRIQEILEAV